MAGRVWAVVAMAVLCATCVPTTPLPQDNFEWAELQAAVKSAQATLRWQSRTLYKLLNTTRDIKKSISRVWGCSPPYKEVLGECFYLSQHYLPWQEARVNCQALQGDLATPSVVSRLFEFLLENGATEHDRVWLGGLNRRGSWRWWNGSSIPKAEWDAGQPSHPLNHTLCLNMRLDLQPSLNDADCKLEYKFACQNNVY